VAGLGIRRPFSACCRILLSAVAPPMSGRLRAMPTSLLVSRAVRTEFMGLLSGQPAAGPVLPVAASWGRLIP